MSPGNGQGLVRSICPCFTCYAERLPEIQFQHYFLSVSSISFADNGPFSKGCSLTVWCMGNELYILGCVLGWYKWVPGELSWFIPAEHSPVQGKPPGSLGNRSAQVSDIHLHMLRVSKPLQGCVPEWDLSGADRWQHGIDQVQKPHKTLSSSWSKRTGEIERHLNRR